MSFYIDERARSEAYAVRTGEITPEILRFSEIAAGLAATHDVYSPTLKRPFDRLKSLAYGHAGIVTADAVELVFAEQHRYGRHRLLHNVGGDLIAATDDDVSSLMGLSACWEETLVEASKRVIDNPQDERRRKNIEAIQGHLALRNLAFGQEQDIYRYFAGGAGTAAEQCQIMTLGMHKFWHQDRSDTQLFIPEIRRSHGPLLSVASLGRFQLDAFNLMYGGVRGDLRSNSYWIMYKKMKSNIYDETRQGTIVLTEAVENLPIKGQEVIGDKHDHFSGPRIGCPILLTPNLLKRLWQCYVDSLAATKLYSAK